MDIDTSLIGISVVNLPIHPSNEGAEFTLLEGGLGHPAVTQSILKVLSLMNYPHNFNPPSADAVFPIAYCAFVRDTKAHLDQLVELKKEGKVRSLIVGPIVDARTIEEYWESIDVIVRPSQFNRQLQPKEFVCPTAPAIEFFTRSSTTASCKQVLLYTKSNELEEYKHLAEIRELAMALLTELSIPFTEVHYGGYTLQEFKDQLEESYAAVFVTSQETQGIALSECWAMNCPTFVFDNYFELTDLFVPVPEAPYLRRENGAAWNTLEQLRFLLMKFTCGELRFTPREWLDANLGYEEIAKAFASILAYCKLPRA